MRIFHNKIKTFISFILSFPLLSCADLIIPELKVTNVSYTSDNVIIQFSKTVNQNLAIESFTFLRDSENQNGSFSFNDSTMIFSPYNKIQDGYHYTIQITTKVEDIYGASLMSPFVYNFTTKGNPSIPEVLSITPKDEEITKENITELTITFSKPIKTESFQNSFSIKPSAQFKTEWENEYKTVRVIFDKPLENSTRYTVTISKSLQDTDNNFIANQFISIFTNNEDLTVPEYKIYAKTDSSSQELFAEDLITLNDQLHINTYLYLEFSKEIQVDKFSSYFSIKPQLSYSIETDNQTKKSVKIIFDDITWNEKTYQITIKNGISDYFNNIIEEDKTYNLCFNNSSEMQPQFVKGFLDLKRNSYFEISSENTYTNMTVPVDDFQEGTDIDTNMYLFFELTPSASEINLISAMENISFSISNACISLTIKQIAPVTKTDFSTLPAELNEIKNLSQSKNIYGLKLLITVDNADPRGQVKLNIGSDIRDNLFNKFGEKLIFAYNKS